jgi:urocanate hydratase
MGGGVYVILPLLDIGGMVGIGKDETMLVHIHVDEEEEVDRFIMATVATARMMRVMMRNRATKEVLLQYILYIYVCIYHIYSI